MKKIIKNSIIILLIIALIYLYGAYVETNRLITHEYSINNSILPDSFDGIKIVHFSDLHYNKEISRQKLKKIIEEINIINPDIVVFTGDLFDEKKKVSSKDVSFLEEQLSKINAKINKYAILGNHDYAYGVEKTKSVLSNSNFIILQNNYDVVYNNEVEKIVIYGIDDVLEKKADLDKTFTLNEENIYKVVLVHEPDYIDSILEKDNTINLILSGHSHNGQIRLPFIKKIYMPKGSKKYFDYHYEINNTSIYISNGLGTSVIKFRLFNPPSINFYRINKEDN